MRPVIVLLALAGAAMATTPDSNPLLAPWIGPAGGVPPFDRAQPEHFEPAFEAAMAEQVRAVEAIAADPAAPTFANTLAALERSGRTLDRVATVYGVFTSTRNDAAMQEVERRLVAIGCAKVNLLIEADNAGVQAYYARLGYAVDPLIFMEKWLG